MRTVTVNRKTGKPHSKTSRILGEFMKGRDLTSLESIGVFGVYRLADVVFKLRNRGYPIVTELKKDPNGSEYANYRLINKGDKVRTRVDDVQGPGEWEVDSVNFTDKLVRLHHGPAIIYRTWSEVEVIHA
jgi:hypothetical protein